VRCTPYVTFGPIDPISDWDVFAKDVNDNITNLTSVTSVFLDDWYTYHYWDGGINCGTNVKREVPPAIKWWE